MNKPTTEELDKGIADALIAAETPEETPQEEQPQETPEESTPVEQEAPASETPKETPEEEEPETPSIDYKKKFTESSRESQVRESLMKKTNEAIDKAAGITEIPEEELVKEFPDWEVMSETEKRLAKDVVINRKRFELIHSSAQEGKDIQAWNEKVDSFIEDPKTLNANPDLEGKTEEFKLFATKATRRGADFDVLVGAFLHDLDKSRMSHKGQMMETGSGGPNTTPQPKSDKLSVEESEKLRQTDYAKYRDMLKAGKISTELE